MILRQKQSNSLTERSCASTLRTQVRNSPWALNKERKTPYGRTVNRAMSINGCQIVGNVNLIWTKVFTSTHFSHTKSKSPATWLPTVAHKDDLSPHPPPETSTHFSHRKSKSRATWLPTVAHKDDLSPQPTPLSPMVYIKMSSMPGFNILLTVLSVCGSLFLTIARLSFPAARCTTLYETNNIVSVRTTLYEHVFIKK